MGLGLGAWQSAPRGTAGGTAWRRVGFGFGGRGGGAAAAAVEGAAVGSDVFCCKTGNRSRKLSFDTVQQHGRAEGK